MANLTSPPQDSSSPDAPQSLVDRVRLRVAEVGDAQTRRASASRPKARRPRAARAERSAASGPEFDATRQARALRRVFHEMGDSHRQYRQQTGERVSPALRDAAHAFKRNRDLPSLVAIAACLDELGLLTW